MPNLAVFGGSGFLGRHICKAGILNGWSVTSISRSVPVHSTDVIPNVEYVSTDVFQPRLYRETLVNADAVIHTIGSFMDNPEYKKLVNEPLAPTTLMKLARLKLQGRNPMSINTFERLNYSSAMVLADAANNVAQERGVKLPFIYISAENWSNFADPEYIESKRRAEHDISSQFHELRPVYLRPGLMYDSTSTSNCWPSARSAITSAIGARDQLSGGAPHRVSVQTVAAAALEAARDEEIFGAVSNEALNEFDIMR